jgi:hypothetical protein
VLVEISSDNQNKRLRNGEREVFTVNTLFNSDVVFHESCAKIELFIYKVIENHVEVDIEKGYTLLSFIKSLAMRWITSASGILVVGNGSF